MYFNEISAMMHTFGDVKNPKEKCVQLMESIVHDQMKLLLWEAEKIAHRLRSPIISHKEVLFLMRKNKMKLKRLLEYIKVWDLKQVHKNDLGDDTVAYKDGKLYEKCLEFLASIEDCNEFTSFIKDEAIVDIIAKKRKMRRFWMTHKMNPKEYGEFSKTSQASFCPLQKFKKWLLKDKVISFDLTDIAVRIVDFLARETIAEIVDMVLIMKMKKMGRYQPLYYDRVDHLVQSMSHSEMNNVLEQANKEGDFEKYFLFSVCSTYPFHRHHSTIEISENEKNLNNSSFRISKESYNASKSEDLNESHPKKNDLLLSSLSGKSQLEHIESNRKYNLIHEVFYSSSKESFDKPIAPCIGENLYKPLNETEFDPVLGDSGSILNQTYDMISDEDVSSNPKSASTNKNNDLKEVAPSEVSDTELVLNDSEDSNNSTLSFSFVNSNSMYQETDVVGDSHQPQEKDIQIQGVLDTSGSKNSTQEVGLSPDHQKSLKRSKSCTIDSKRIAQEASFVIKSAIEKHFMEAAQDEANHITEPIERVEILEAVSLFQEPSPMVLIYACDHIPKKTKLICLADHSLMEL